MIRFVRKSQGMTLMETMIASSVGILIFLFLGYLVIFSARNAINIRDQVVAQSSAATANQSLAALITARATDFQPYSGDTLTSLTRVKFDVPDPSNPAVTIARTLCWDPQRKWLEYFDNSSNVSFSAGTVNGKSYQIPSGTPTRKFTNISDFIMTMESHEKLDLTLYFQYKGYAKHTSSALDLQYGEFHVVLVAKNHFVAQGSDNDYAIDTTSPLVL